MLTGQIKKYDDIPADSMLRHFPRFQPENFDINIKLVEQVEELAKNKGCSPAQLAIGWIRSLSKRPGMPVIVPIPGATSAELIKENSSIIDLNEEELKEIEVTLAKFEVKGSRYPAGVPIDT